MKEITFHIIISKCHSLFKLDSIKMFIKDFSVTINHAVMVKDSIFIPRSYLNITIVHKEIKSKTDTYLIWKQ